jgi:hypothetical protein
VVFKIPKTEKPSLDRAEGLGHGYHQRDVSVDTRHERHGPQKAFTYVADSSHIDDELQPYAWYKEFVLRGARDFRLPKAYVRNVIDSVGSIADPNPARTKKNGRLLSMRVVWAVERNSFPVRRGLRHPGSARGPRRAFPTRLADRGDRPWNGGLR